MARPPTVHGAEVELIYSLDNQRIENVLHFDVNASVTSAVLTQLAADIATWAAASLMPGIPAACSLVSIIARSLEASAPPAIEYTTGLPIAGGHSASAVMPNNVSAATKFLTGLAGRSYRGRAYWPCFGESQVTGNGFAAGVTTGLTATWNALRSTPFTTHSYVHCVLSEVSGGAQRAFGVLTAVTNCVTEGTVDSQRRRLPGRGR